MKVIERTENKEKMYYFRDMVRRARIEYTKKVRLTIFLRCGVRAAATTAVVVVKLFFDDVEEVRRRITVVVLF